MLFLNLKYFENLFAETLIFICFRSSNTLDDDIDAILRDEVGATSSITSSVRKYHHRCCGLAGRKTIAFLVQCSMFEKLKLDHLFNILLKDENIL